jgi:hypothetical protein
VGQPVILAIREAILDGDILAVNPAEFTQSSQEALDKGAASDLVFGARKPYPRNP